MNKDKIIEKIKKLLELTTSPNEFEAQRAMEQAQKLMLRFAISESQLANVESNEVKISRSEYWNSNFGVKTGLMEHAPNIVGTIGPIFGVYGLSQIRNGSVKRIDLIGFPTNIDIARFALDSIITQGVLEAKIAYKTYRTTSFGDSFWKGFALGLHKKFSSFKDNAEGIIIYDEVKQFVNSLSTGTYRAPSDNDLAHRSGFEAGQRVELRRGLESKNEGKLLK